MATNTTTAATKLPVTDLVCSLCKKTVRASSPIPDHKFKCFTCIKASKPATDVKVENVAVESKTPVTTPTTVPVATFKVKKVKTSEQVIDKLQKQLALKNKEIEQLKKDIKIRDEQILKLTDSAFSADKWGL